MKKSLLTKSILELRLQGCSYTQICKATGTSKGNISYICNALIPKDVHLQHIQQAILRAKPQTTKALLKARKAAQIYYENERNKKAVEYLTLLNNYKNKNFTFFVGGLYLGEGAHSNRLGQRTTFNLSNSDPSIITYFMRFLTNVLKLDRSRMIITLTLHASENKEQALIFWKEKALIQTFDYVRQCDTRPQAKAHLHNAYKEYHGTVLIDVKQPNGLRLALKQFLNQLR